MDRISKNTQISNFMDVRSLGTELFHADGRTEEQRALKKLIVAFRKFA